MCCGLSIHYLLALWTMGWGNTRPLPACIYHEIREQFSTQGANTGYLAVENRDLDFNNTTANITLFKTFI